MHIHLGKIRGVCEEAGGKAARPRQHPDGATSGEPLGWGLPSPAPCAGGSQALPVIAARHRVARRWALPASASKL